MKALIKLKNNLVENKVDVHRYFTEDEKFMIEEGEYLMKKGKLHV